MHCRLLDSEYLLLVILVTFWLVVDCLLFIVGCWSLFVYARLFVVNYQLLCDWLLVVGCSVDRSACVGCLVGCVDGGLLVVGCRMMRS